MTAAPAAVQAGRSLRVVASSADKTALSVALTARGETDVYSLEQEEPGLWRWEKFAGATHWTVPDAGHCTCESHLYRKPGQPPCKHLAALASLARRGRLA